MDVLLGMTLRAFPKSRSLLGLLVDLRVEKLQCASKTSFVILLQCFYFSLFLDIKKFSEIVNRLNLPWVAMLSLDSFYKGLSSEDSESASDSYNFDHPSAFDFELLEETLSKLREVTLANY